MRGSNQGGSLAGFIIIGAVLALVLVGGLYGINRYNAEQTKIAASKEESSKKAAETKKEAAKTDEKPSETPIPNDATSLPSNTTTQEAKDQVATAQLPRTGPADTLLQLVSVAALSFASVYYLRSRSYAHTRAR